MGALRTGVRSSPYCHAETAGISLLSFDYMRTRILLALVSSCFASMLVGQLSMGGEPYGWGEAAVERSAVPEVVLPELDPEELPASVPPHGGFRYGTQRSLEVDVLAEGQWRVLPDGMLLCELAVRSPGAVMMSLQFDQWELPEGAVVYLYDAQRRRFIGGFDHNNRGTDGSMATEILPGDAVVISCRIPAGVRGMGRLHLASVTHGLVDVFKFYPAVDERDYDPGYQSAACHINTICPEASAWQLEKRSVAMFLRPDGGGCTGNLVNNTQTPGRPYFHMANHCYLPTTSQWVFYFNYESPTCVGSTGPTTQTLTGATLRAAYYYNDMCLVELTNTPPPSYGAYYAGWDRSGAVPQTSVVIEHPLYDVKKIAFNNDPSTTFTDAIGVPNWRGNWDAGLVQAVASGAPLFDQNKRMVGHMYDGPQNCTTATTVPSDCAKFSAGWDGASASVRMRDWLDPSNTVMQLNGYDPNATPTVSVRVKAFLEGPYNTGTARMNSTLRASSLLPLAEPYTALGYVHSGGGGGEVTTQSVFNVTGVNAVVDWVVVELRNKNNSSQVLASRSALLQADGDVVGMDGSSAVVVNLSSDNYFIALRHRNHLGIMAASAIALTSTAITVDLSNGSVALFGASLATTVVGTRNAMVAGDSDRNGVLSYTGQNNDRDPILSRIGGAAPTATVAGYFVEDLNLDGVVQYVGTGNDRDIILVNIGGSVPTGTRAAQLP